MAERCHRNVNLFPSAWLLEHHFSRSNSRCCLAPKNRSPPRSLQTTSNRPQKADGWSYIRPSSLPAPTFNILFGISISARTNISKDSPWKLPICIDTLHIPSYHLSKYSILRNNLYPLGRKRFHRPLACTIVVFDVKLKCRGRAVLRAPNSNSCVSDQQRVFLISQPYKQDTSNYCFFLRMGRKPVVPCVV